MFNSVSKCKNKWYCDFKKYSLNKSWQRKNSRLWLQNRHIPYLIIMLMWTQLVSLVIMEKEWQTKWSVDWISPIVTLSLCDLWAKNVSYVLNGWQKNKEKQLFVTHDIAWNSHFSAQE